MSVEIRVASDKDAALWDRLVGSSPHGTIFHTWKWLKIAEKHSFTKLYPLILFNEGTPVGIMPLFYKRKIFRLAFSPPPNVAIPFLGALINPEGRDVYHDIVNAINNFVFNELKASYLTAVLPPHQNDVRPYIKTGYQIDPVFNYVFDLTLGKEALWRNLKKKTRRNIDKAKSRLNVVEGGIEDLRLIYSQLKQRYEEQRRRMSCSLEYLEEIYNNFKGNIQILVAEMNGEKVAGLVNIIYKDRIYSWVGNAKVDLDVYPNDLLIWGSIEYGCDAGFKTFYEIGAGDPRLARYKSNFNPNLIVNFNVKKSSPLLSIVEKTYLKYLRNYVSV